MYQKTPESLVNHILNTMDVWLVTQRKSLESAVPNRLIRWFLRWVFQRYGFAARDYDGRSYASIEFRGAFLDEAEARWFANCEGGAVKPIPLNDALPEETVSYKAGDVPLSEASPWYRQGVELPFEAVRRGEVKARRERLLSLERKLDGLDARIQGEECPTAMSRVV